jgi:hypothetical protein
MTIKMMIAREESLINNVKADAELIGSADQREEPA